MAHRKEPSNVVGCFLAAVVLILYGIGAFIYWVVEQFS